MLAPSFATDKSFRRVKDKEVRDFTRKIHIKTSKMRRARNWFHWKRLGLEIFQANMCKSKHKIFQVEVSTQCASVDYLGFLVQRDKKHRVLTSLHE